MLLELRWNYREDTCYTNSTGWFLYVRTRVLGNMALPVSAARLASRVVAAEIFSRGFAKQDCRRRSREDPFEAAQPCGTTPPMNLHRRSRSGLQATGKEAEPVVHSYA